MTPKTKHDAPRSVLIFAKTAFDDQIPMIMKSLRERHGTRFTLAVNSEARAKVGATWCGPEDHIITISEISDESEAAAASLDTEDAFQVASANEDRYGVIYIRDILMQDREYAGYYLPFAPNDPHSAIAPPSLTHSVKLINWHFDYFERIFEEHAIDLVWGQPGHMATTTAILVALRRGVPTTFSTHSRFGTNYLWASTGYLGDRRIKEAYDRVPDNITPLAPLDKPLADYTLVNMAMAREWRSFEALVMGFYYATINRVIWRTRDLFRGRWSKRLPYFVVLRRHVQQWRQYRALDRMVEKDMERLCARPFVLFLLSLEPEFTTLTLAKEFNNTLATVQQLSLCLPAGVNLVVKEHVTNIGNRDTEFYRRLLHLPNVILADYNIRGVDLAAQARAVSAISGTIGIEATMLGKPVVIFSTRTEYGFLPNVRMVTSFHDLPDAVRDALRDREPAEVENIRMCGARFRQAVLDLSFDMPEGIEMKGSGAGLSAETADRASELLVANWRAQRADLAEAGASSHRRAG